MAEKSKEVSRRHMLQVLAASGITGASAIELLAQIGDDVSPDTLKIASALIDQGFSEERLEVISKALQRNLEQFEIVRNFEIDDMIEPAPIFMAKGGHNA